MSDATVAMTQPPSKNPLKHLRPGDLRGIAQLATEATTSVARIAEGVHQSVWDSLGVAGRAPGQTGGITGFVYQAVQGVAQLLGKGADTLLATLQMRLESRQGSEPATPQREAALAVLNGVMGDRLLASNNPLATPMTLRHQGLALDWQAPPAGLKPKVLLMIHGLCMNDLQWQRKGHSHGDALGKALGMTPLYLHYNTGLHVSQNGEMFSQAMQTLIEQWPVPVEELVVIGHSMGGLVARSACHHAEVVGLNWPATLRRLVCLGTPHHGAPLERGGQLIDSLLGKSPYLAPFARLGKGRSAGISDLRFGNVQQADWSAHRKHDQKVDGRLPTPLPLGVQTYLVAAVQAQRVDDARNAWIGDGLVPRASALGEHESAAMSLLVPDSHKLVVTNSNHWDLLNHAEVYQQLLAWLSQPFESERRD